MILDKNGKWLSQILCERIYLKDRLKTILSITENTKYQTDTTYSQRTKKWSAYLD